MIISSLLIVGFLVEVKYRFLLELSIVFEVTLICYQYFEVVAVGISCFSIAVIGLSFGRGFSFSNGLFIQIKT